MRPQRCMGNGKHVHKIQEKGQSHVLFAFKSLVITSAILDDSRGRRLCGLNLNELEIVRVCRNPTTVVTADGEVQTREEASAHVHDLDLFVTVQILGDTPAVLSPCELYEEHGYSLEWASGQKPHLTLEGQNHPMHHGKLCANRCPRISNRFFQFECKYISYIITAGHV